MRGASRTLLVCALGLSGTGLAGLSHVVRAPLPHTAHTQAAGLSVERAEHVPALRVMPSHHAPRPQPADANKPNAYTPASSSVVSSTVPARLEKPLPSASLVTQRLAPAVVGQPYHVRMVARGGQAPYRWSITDGWLPQGLRLDPAQGLISGTPSRSQMTPFTIQICDAAEHCATRAFTLAALEVELPTPSPETERLPLTIVTSSLPDGVVGRDYFAQVRADGGVPPYGWSLVGGALPEGLVLDQQVGVIAGVPTEDGSFQLQVMVHDAQGTAFTASFSLRITTSPLYLVSGSPPGGYVGVLYEYVLAAQGGRPPYLWSLVSGALPDGLMLEPRGRLVGVPAKAGLFIVRIMVSDQHDASDTAEFKLTIQLTVQSEPPPEEEPVEEPPEPEEPPIEPATDLQAFGSDRKVGLIWRNPTSPRYHHTVLVRRTGHHPATPTDGTIAYSGTETQYLDTGLVNGTTYYYTAFALDAEGRASEPVDGSRAIATPQAVTIAGGQADPYADAVTSMTSAFTPTPTYPNPFGMASMPTIVLGPPHGAGTGAGSLDVVSLGCGINADGSTSAPYGGSITLEFRDNLIVDDPGVDFTVFENVFYESGDPQKRFMEPAIVSVSQDGVAFYTIPFDYVPHFTPSGALDVKNPFAYSQGFAGINPVYSNLGSPDPTNPAVSGGDSFDLADVPVRPPLRWARFVRLTGTGDRWLTDMNGDLVRHTTNPLLQACNRSYKSGFDLDAVTVVHY